MWNGVTFVLFLIRHFLMTLASVRSAPFAHGFQPAGDAGVWNVWAPRASRVDLVLLYADSRRICPMPAVEEGWFQYVADKVSAGQRYLFRLDDDRERPDPASRWQPDGVHAASAVWRPIASEWTDAHWSGVQLEGLVIYEVHVGAFTPEGTFDACIPRLAELRSLGITAIELMPVGQFPGTRGWGYDGTYWFAAQHNYGGPHGLQRLVDASHRCGLAVIMDVVYNHLGPEGNYLREFGPYFTESHTTPWGAAVNFDDEGCEGMRSLVLDNVRHWVRDFHVDGLRLDAVHAIFDDSRPHILAEIKQVAMEEERRLGRPIHVFAESNLNDVRLLDPPEQGGYGLDAQWNDDFHHCVHALLTGERDGYYTDFDDPPRQLVKALQDAFVFDGAFSTFRGRPHGRPVGEHGGERFVVSVQTHDQVGNRALGERLSVLTAPSSQRLAACLLLLAPHVPLLFMGEEYGERNPFPFFCDFGDPALQAAVRRGRREEFARFTWDDEIPDPLAPATFASAKLAWEWPEGTSQAGLRHLYHDLLHLRRTQPALRDFRHRAAQLMTSDNDQPLLIVTRGKPGCHVSCIFNLGSQAAKSPREYRDIPWLLHSEDACYRGEAAEPDNLDRRWLRPNECFVLELA